MTEMPVEGPTFALLHGIPYIDGFSPWHIEPHKLGWLVAEYSIGVSTFQIYGSDLQTLDAANKVLDDRQALIKTYHFLSGDYRSALPLHACRSVVLWAISVAWFQFNGFDVPVQVTSGMEKAMAKAAKTEAAAETAEAPKTKEPRITNRSIIETGLLAGTPDEEILAEVKAQFPDGKADMKHIAYYRHFLVKEGKLEAQPRKARAKKEVAEAAPAPVKAAAAPAARAVAAPVKVAAKPAAKPVAAPVKAAARRA